LYRLIPPKYVVSKVAEIIKKKYQQTLKQKVCFLENVYWNRQGIWGKGYFVSTIDINEELIRRYLESPEEEEMG